mmetsp:Transcript_33341/g.37919  ORF Transcript_33341/g.37919 Transcript_33341/m.37919 type:complete len:179 (-) Transcript_33341:220-756(-)
MAPFIFDMDTIINHITSWEILFWLPTLLDLLLLVVTYGYCNYYGVLWYLETQAEVLIQEKKAANKKKDCVMNGENFKPVISTEVKLIWELAMVTYTAYACLFPTCVYICTIYPKFRTMFCWAMTILMLKKASMLYRDDDPSTNLFKLMKKEEGMNSLIYFYVPTYGGYAILKTFFLYS